MALLADILTRYAPEDASAFPGCGDVQRVEMKGGLAGIEPAHASACGAVRMDGGAAAMRRKAIHALYSSSANLVRKTAHDGRPAHLPTADPGPIGGGRASGGGGGLAELRVPDDAELELLEACARLRKAGANPFLTLVPPPRSGAASGGGGLEGLRRDWGMGTPVALVAPVLAIAGLGLLTSALGTLSRLPGFAWVRQVVVRSPAPERRP
jgi:hypothetical protein